MMTRSRYGVGVGTLSVQASVRGAWSSVWNKRGQHQRSRVDASRARWARGVIVLPHITARVRFKGIKGSSSSGDIAVGEIAFPAIISKWDALLLQDQNLH